MIDYYCIKCDVESASDIKLKINKWIEESGVRADDIINFGTPSNDDLYVWYKIR